MKETVHLVGGGLVGPLAAIYLAREGIEVELYERRDDIRKGNVDAGRSINLVVTKRGLLALEKVGLKEKVLELSLPLQGRMLHDTNGVETYVAYGQKEDEVIHAVSRGLLNQRLLEEADHHPNINIHFQQRCTHYDPERKMLTFRNEETNQERTIEAEVTIGTDGAFSAIRKAMLDHLPNFNYSQEFQDYGYKELVIPAGQGGNLRKDALHIWPRGDFMLIGIPNLDGSFTCTLFLAYKGENSFERLQTEQDLERFFSELFPDALERMPTLKQDFFQNPTGSLTTIRCNPWHIGGQAMLLGDAAHAIVPFYGQGMNCGFEDCTALGELLDGGEREWSTLFERLGNQRKPNSDAIADMAIENFVEMRDTTDDPKFQLKKQIGFALEKRFPAHFIPRYSMVQFHPEISFSEAKRRGEKQEGMLDELAKSISSPDELDWNKAEALVMAQGGHNE